VRTFPSGSRELPPLACHASGRACGLEGGACVFENSLRRRRVSSKIFPKSVLIIFFSRGLPRGFASSRGTTCPSSPSGAPSAFAVRRVPGSRGFLRTRCGPLSQGGGGLCTRAANSGGLIFRGSPVGTRRRSAVLKERGLRSRRSALRHAGCLYAVAHNSSIGRGRTWRTLCVPCVGDITVPAAPFYFFARLS